MVKEKRESEMAMERFMEEAEEEEWKKGEVDGGKEKG